MAEMLPFNEKPFHAALAEIDELRATLDARGPLPLAWEGQLRRDLEAAAVQASVEMEGVAVTVEEVRRILAGDTPGRVSAEDAALVQGYREAMTYVQSRADDPVFRWSSELLKAIHHRVLAARRGASRYGEARFVADRATGDVIYTPPQDDIAELVEALCDRMNSWDAHPALHAAWAHVAFAAIHPFKDGNGRTARILSSLAMYRGGYKRPEFCSLEEWWGTHKAGYYAAFACLGRAFDPSADVTPFVRAHVDAQRSQVRALALREETNRAIWTALTRVSDEAGLPDRAAFALWDAYQGREITRPYYRAVADVSQSAATMDFSRLRSASLLTPRGRTRGRSYGAGPRLFPLLAAAVGLRTDDPDRAAIVQAVTERLATLHALRG
jgi:Fic family protein